MSMEPESKTDIYINRDNVMARRLQGWMTNRASSRSWVVLPCYSQLKSAKLSAGLIAHASEGGAWHSRESLHSDVFDDDFLVIGARWKKVFSPMPAPCLNGLSDRLPVPPDRSTQQGYNSVKIINFQVFRFIRCSLTYTSSANVPYQRR